jgi:glycerol kinase
LVVWRFDIGELLAAALRYRYLKFQPFCIKMILEGIQKSEITDCDTGGCGMWVVNVGFPIVNPTYIIIYFGLNRKVLARV